jgi:hypothetical protein
MIRDPSDGSVREPQKPAPAFKAAQNTAESDPPVTSDWAGAGPVIETTENLRSTSVDEKPVLPSMLSKNTVRDNDLLSSTTSGLRTGSKSPEHMARLKKSEAWLRDYRAGKFKQTDGE